ncbi:hypothetical protein GGR54DRAFT_206185 [Hypoxylon sp. NC1633]|nr:hypothetical protein GGR54DRAFT_206185 [Hypoxylon sp. NC1633]
MSSTDVDQAPAVSGLGGGKAMLVVPEIILMIMEVLSPSDVEAFARTSKKTHEVFTAHKYTVMINVLEIQPEFKSLLYMHTIPGNHPQDRIFTPLFVDFVPNKAGPDHHGCVRKINIQNIAPIDPEKVGRPDRIRFDERDIKILWKCAKIIDWWVATFPRLRWRNDPLSRRSLRPTEVIRVRKAVGQWWLYAVLHHGFRFRYRSRFEPRMFHEDPRLHQIRLLTTSEIIELRELWDLVRETVRLELCVSPVIVCHCEYGLKIEFEPWSKSRVLQEMIVKTYTKVDPFQLGLLLRKYANWRGGNIDRMLSEGRPKFERSMIRMVWGGNRQFENSIVRLVSGISFDLQRDCETLTLAIDCVKKERMAHFIYNRGFNALFPSTHLGILDTVGGSQLTIAGWVDDAWPTGEVPLPQLALDMFKRLTRTFYVVPHGQDGVLEIWLKGLLPLVCGCCGMPHSSRLRLD